MAAAFKFTLTLLQHSFFIVEIERPSGDFHEMIGNQLRNQLRDRAWSTGIC